MAKANEIVVKEKYSANPSQEVMESIISEMEDLLVTRTKEARESAMKVAWEVGEFVREKEKTHRISVTSIVTKLAMDNRIGGRQMGETNLWFAIKLFDWSLGKFEKLYSTEHGENVTISKLKKLLSTPKPKKHKSMKELAISLVEKLGIDQCQDLIAELEHEIEIQERKVKSGKGQTNASAE